MRLMYNIYRFVDEESKTRLRAHLEHEGFAVFGEDASHYLIHEKIGISVQGFKTKAPDHLVVYKGTELEQSVAAFDGVEEKHMAYWFDGADDINSFVGFLAGKGYRVLRYPGKAFSVYNGDAFVASNGGIADMLNVSRGSELDGLVQEYLTSSHEEYH